MFDFFLSRGFFFDCPGVGGGEILSEPIGRMNVQTHSVAEITFFYLINSSIFKIQFDCRGFFFDHERVNARMGADVKCKFFIESKQRFL